MAVAAKRRVVVNAGKRRTKRNKPRHMTAKQIKYFGSPAQKRNLKMRRHRAASPARKTVNRARSYHRPRKSPARKNPGEILSLVLNPGGRKGKNMAAPRRRRKSSASSGGRVRRRRRSVANPHHRRRRRRTMSNPAPRRRRNYTRHHRRHNRRRNPGGMGGFQHDIMQAIAAFGGYFGSKLATQLVMGSGNTGVAGYMGNAAATAALAIIAGVFPPTKKLVTMVVAGGAIQIIARVLSDNTAFGTLTSQLGVGDYQMQNFVTPQRLQDPLNSAAIEIPSGWGAAPAVVVSSNAPPGATPAHGTSGYASAGMGRGLYSPAGIYS